MLPLRLAAALALAAATCSAQEPPKPDPTSAIARLTVLDAKNKGEGGGNAFWIAPDLAVTNWHVVLLGKRGVLDMTDGASHTITAILAVNEQTDLAVVMAEPPFSGTPLALAPQPAQRGQRVRIVPSPLLISEPPITATVARTAPLPFMGESFLLDTERGITHGWSGSPVLDDQGRVLGVVSIGAPAKIICGAATAIAPLRAGPGTPWDRWDDNATTRFGRSMMAYMAVAEGSGKGPKWDLAALKQAVDESPDLWLAWGALGRNYLEAGRTDDAIKALSRAVQTSPMAQDGMSLFRAYMAKGDMANAGPVIQHVQDTDPAGLAYEQAKDQAISTATSGRHEAALPGLAKAVAAAPEDLNTRVMYAQALVFSGKPAEALPHLDLILRRTPGEPAALYGRGLALGKLGRNEESLAALQAALKAQPNSPSTMKAVGEAYLRLDRADDARTVLASLRPLDPRRAADLEQAIGNASPPKK